MNSNILHIISFDNPYPPNYGGRLDVFFKIKAFHNQGIKIILHCFVNNNDNIEDELSLFCYKIYFYNKNICYYNIFSKIPFSIIVRNSVTLLKKRIKPNESIFFEGLKTTLSIIKGDFVNNPKFLRLHNLEDNYFKGIAQSENHILKKNLFRLEAYKYGRISILKDFSHIFSLSNYEQGVVEKINKQSTYIPVFSGNNIISKLSEFGKYILFHGDLRTSDNFKVVTFFIDFFKEYPQFKFVIASSSKQEEINKLILNFSNISFIKLKNEIHLNELLAYAHINICWSFQQSGTKLKLLNALYKSRFCLINENVIDDNDALKVCDMVTDSNDLFNKIEELMMKPYTESFIKMKQTSLNKKFNDVVNIKKIIEIINQNSQIYYKNE